MYGSEHTAHHSSGYPSAESVVSGSGYAYYPNHHHHHLHHHHFHANSEFLSTYPTHHNTSPAHTTPPLAASNTSTAAMYHPHLYSPAAAEYGITTSSNHSPAEQQFFDADNGVLQSYYANGQSASNAANVDQQQQQQSSASAGGLAEAHIISSDNGLSYTNLDYMYGPPGHANNAMYLHADDKSTIGHYGESAVGHLPPQQHHSIIASASATVGSSWQSHQSHHNSAYLEGSIAAAHSVAMSCMGAGGHPTSGGTGRGLVAVPTEQQHQQQQSQPAAQPQQQQPTYKWMQVKRNVPKPQGKHRGAKNNEIVCRSNIRYCFEVNSKFTA